MKKISFLIIGLLVIRATAITQCLPDGIEFTTQIEIDSFQINYPNCVEIIGNVTINGADITNVSGLDSLKSIGGNLLIKYNDHLHSLTGLESLDRIGKNLTISNNNKLNNLTGLNSLKNISGSFDIRNNTNLLDFAGLELLNVIKQNFRVEYNESLIDFSGLENLSSLDGFMIINDCQKLENFNALNKLDSIGGYLEIKSNNKINNFSGLEKLVFIGGDFIVWYCGIDNFEGLNNLNKINGDLKITRCDALINFDGLDSLTSINGSFHIGSGEWMTGNPSLNSLNGLEHLQLLGGELHIRNNERLTTLNGIENIDPASIQKLVILENVSLITCHVKSVCDYLVSPTGSIYIDKNKTGCDSRNEVEKACGIDLVETLPMQKTFTLFPNPVTETLTVEFDAPPKEVRSIELCNSYGAIIETHNLNSNAENQKLGIDMKDLRSGIYFLRIRIGEEVLTSRVVKL